ncbi:MAG: hypothetical protein Q8K93_31740 [Reyranella sp.]|uniref:hypothetical protein n=1 Tax=Reyranella sp. TaxID=1929291 RepID=UPI00272F0BD1|nr:hypothetical protein [Reyranella sp.]MDP1966764.1 hypothetical protein [Reyranella sp.]MDP2372200.1 hypothetical protein [Reyranella sp.]
MRKELGLVLMGAVAFDLGTIVVPQQALAQKAMDMFIKIDSLSNEFNYSKVDIRELSAAKNCTDGKGTLVEYRGDKYCRTPKAATAAPTQRR